MGQIERLLQQPKLYNNIDGVGELAMGFFLAAVAAFQWVQLHAAPHSFWNQAYTVVIFFLLLGAIIDRGTKAIKRHITYPRTGYVEYRRRDTVWLPMVLGAVAAGLIAAGVAVAIRRHWDGVSLGVIAGLAIAAAYGYGLARTARWKWIVAVVMALAAPALAMVPARWLAVLANHSWAQHFHLSGPHIMGSMVLMLITYGAIFLVSGTISFWLYLRHTQPPAEVAE